MLFLKLIDIMELSENYSSDNNVKIKQELECATQTIHDLKRQLDLCQALQTEYQEEINDLNTKLTDAQAYKSRFLQLEENIRMNDVVTAEQIASLNAELELKKSLIKDLERKIEDFEDREITKRISYPEITNEKELHEIQDLTIENNSLKEKLITITVECETMSKMCQTLQEENQNLNDCINSQRSELNENRTCIQSLQEELALLHTDMDSLKNKPLDEKKKGNSLFAEVNDKRVQLQSQMRFIKKRYMEMKGELSASAQANEQLRISNAKLINEINLIQNGEEKDLLIDPLEHKVQELENLIANYKVEIGKLIKSRDEKGFSNHNYIHRSSFQDNTCCLQLLEALEMKSTDYYILAKTLYTQKKECRTYYLENLKLTGDIAQLNIQLDSLKADAQCNEPSIMIKEPTNIIPQTHNPHDRSTIWERLQEDGLEITTNAGGPKKVVRFDN